MKTRPPPGRTTRLLNRLLDRVDIELPHNLTKETMQSLISQVVDEDGKPLWSRVRFDLTRLNFIDPTGVVVLCNLVDYLKRVQVGV